MGFDDEIEVFLKGRVKRMANALCEGLWQQVLRRLRVISLKTARVVGNPFICDIVEGNLG